MALLDLFSKRARQRRGELPDVYFYDEIPAPLRVQIVQILDDALGDPHESYEAGKAFEFVHNALAREYGVFALHREAQDRRYRDALFQFFLQESDVEKALDVVEVSFRYVERIASGDHYRRDAHPKVAAEEALNELNARFREHGVGYEFQSEEIIRVDSKLLHESAVKPALAVLQGEAFAGANDEFLRAFEHYRHARYKECLSDCLKAFESTMKTICEKRRWKYEPTDTAKTLIAICLDNGLVPMPLQSHFASLRANLESGIPTVRNKLGAHGQGTSVVEVPPYLAAYLLHLTASTIVFLADADSR